VSDPPVRADKRCHVCKGPRGRIPKTLVKRTAAELVSALAADPFCSATCARVFHGTSLPATGKRHGKKAGPLKHGTEWGYVRGCRCDDCTAEGRAARPRRRERRAAA